MREIKFRVWHNKLKCMLYPPSNIDSMPYCRDSQGNHRYLEIDLGSELLSNIIKEPLTAHMTWDGRWYINGKYQDVIWMQYTGLKDKNNREIYEGDIVRYSHPYLDHPVDFEVVFQEGAFVQRHIIEKHKPDLYYEWYELTVIGNVYENGAT